MSKTRLIHHIVFATKHRKPAINKENKRKLYAYIYGIITNHKCFLLRINGIEDHVHILVDLHPTVAVANLVKEIKQYSSHWIKSNNDFPDFDGWNEGYYAITLGPENIEACRQYIINQEIHHTGINLIDEVKSIANENNIDWFPDDWK